MLPREDFAWQVKDRGLRQSRCRECHAVVMARYHADNRARLLGAKRALWKQYDSRAIREANLRRAYGITSARYEAILNAQGGVCAICLQQNFRERYGKKEPLHVDHNHDTKAVRGLLCHACNSGLGSFRDNQALLMRAATYLLERADMDWRLEDRA